MKLLLTYTSYPLTADDWRGRFMHDLAHGLAGHGNIDLKLWGPPGPTPDAAEYITSSEDAEWLRELLLSGGMAHLLRHKPLAGLVAAAGLLRRQHTAIRHHPEVDVLHINWLQNAFSMLGTKNPAVITALGTDMRLLSWPGIIQFLRYVFRGRRIILAPNSQWMVPILRKHFGTVADIRCVPFGIDRRWFNIKRQTHADQPRRWLAVLRVTSKKIGPLFEWGEDLFNGNDELHLFGPMQEHMTIPAWVHYHGPTNPDTLAGKWYPRAAGMVSLSAHDEGRPQVLLEAMAAGLPVLVSSIPAHRDLVIDDENGLIIESASALRESIARLGDQAENSALGERAQRWVKNHIGTWQDCVERYVVLYNELCQ